jgi:hypothetical protein
MNKFSKFDIVVISFLIVISLFSYNFKNPSGTKKLKLLINNKIAYLPFKNDIIDLKKKYNKNIKIEIKDKKARFIYSDCLNKYCIRQGWISKCGDTAICMPNKTAIQIECKESKVDAVSQ